MGLAIVLARLIEVELQPEDPASLSAEAAAEEAAAEEAEGGGEIAQTSGSPEGEAASEPEPTEPTGRTYTIQPRDTLQKISQKVYGTSHRWRSILDANRDVIPDERRMRPGIVLRIPEGDD